MSESAPGFRYGEHPPSEEVAPWVLSYWTFQADALGPDAPRYTVWPDGCTSIALARAPSIGAKLVCTGPRLTAMQPPIHAHSRLWGIRLWPDAITPVLDVPARALRDWLGPPPPAVATRFAGLSAALPRADDPQEVFPALDRWARATLATARPPDPRLRAAVRAIVAARGETPMEAVAREAGLGLRQLQRRFPEATGLTLREWARVRRLREALALRLSSVGGTWSRIAADTGFVDHAHLTREFLALTGLPPSIVARQLASTTHGDVRP